MNRYGSGTVPFAPFDPPVTPPSASPTDGDQWTVTMSADWWVLVAGACSALTADSSWLIDDFEVLHEVRKWAYDVIRQINLRQPVMNLVFRPNPTHPQNLDFSVDGGTTYNLTADTAAHITPEFLADGSAPGGYDLSVNGGYTQTAFPMLTATDPNAVVTDPLTSLVNDIVPGLDINALKLIAQGNATPLQLVNQGIALGQLLLLIAAI